MIEERRGCVRLEIGLEFSYKLKGEKGDARKAKAKNISSGGIMAALDESIGKGDWLELDINIPTRRKPINCMGKVIWTADKKAGKIDAGIKFEEIDPELKNKYLEYVCDLMYAELKKLRIEHGIF